MELKKKVEKMQQLSQELSTTKDKLIKQMEVSKEE